MAKLIVEEQKDYPTLPADAILHLQVENVEVRTVNGPRGEWDKLEFKFKVLGVLHVPTGDVSQYQNIIGENMYGSTPYKLTDSQENKLRLWSEAILGRPLEVGFELDTDYFLRREVRGITSTYEKRTKDSKGNPYIGHQINSLLPLGGGNAVPGQAPQAPQVQQAPPSPWGAPQPPQAPQVPQQAAPQQGGWGVPGQAPAQQAPAQDPWAAPAQPNPWPAPAATDDEPPF